MTDEQKERMARNRALAEERRRQKKLEKSLMENTTTTADIEPQVQSQPENTVTEETITEGWLYLYEYMNIQYTKQTICPL